MSAWHADGVAALGCNQMRLMCAQTAPLRGMCSSKVQGAVLGGSVHRAVSLMLAIAVRQSGAASRGIKCTCYSPHTGAIVHSASHTVTPAEKADQHAALFVPVMLSMSHQHSQAPDPQLQHRCALLLPAALQTDVCTHCTLHHAEYKDLVPIVHHVHRQIGGMAVRTMYHPAPDDRKNLPV